MMQRDLHTQLAEHRRNAESTLIQLCDRSPEICGHFDVSSTAKSVSRLWRNRGYDAVPQSISMIWQQIRHQLGEDAVGQFNRMLLCELISTAERRISESHLPKSVIHEYVEAFGRILNKLDETPNVYSEPYDDTFLKDLGVCSQTMIPAGYCVMDITNRISREHFFSGGVHQFFKFSWLDVVQYHHSGPFLFVHYHADCKAKFTPEGREETYRIIAQLMASRAELKAVVGTAWYYDPVLRSVSPHLSYVRALPESNGAYFFQGRVEKGLCED